MQVMMGVQKEAARKILRRPAWVTSDIIGILCGSGAALGWAIGFVAARHGISIGLRPMDLALHRYIWAGVIFLPFVFWSDAGNPAGIGWARSFAMTVFGGPLLAILSYSGFLLVPLGHGAVIQPSSAALGGLLLAVHVLRETLPGSRVIGAVLIVVGLVVFGGEAVTTIGMHGLLGDLSFVAAGFSWACFGVLVGFWRIDPIRAVAAVSVFSLLIYLPVHALLFGFSNMFAAGFLENLLQLVVQGVFAGALSIFFYARAVALLGASRAAVFPALVPGFTMLTGFLVLGEIPSLVQIAGFLIVTMGFRFAMMR